MAVFSTTGAICMPKYIESVSFSHIGNVFFSFFLLCLFPLFLCNMAQDVIIDFIQKSFTMYQLGLAGLIPICPF